MSENLFCPGLVVPSPEYLEHYEQMKWESQEKEDDEQVQSSKQDA